MKRRIFALLFVSLTLIMMGVGVYALQPPESNILSEYIGFWQNQPQNGGISYSYESYACSCGASLYSLDLDHFVNEGDIINIAPTSGVGQITYADCGIVTYDINNPHDFSFHENGVYFYSGDVIYTTIQKNVNTPMNLVILIESRNAERFLADTVFFTNNVKGAAYSTVRTYAIVNTLTSIYDSQIYDMGASYGYGLGRDDGYISGYGHGYADGQINATENVTIIGMVDEIISGVAMSLNPILSFEILGVSALSLLGLMCTLFVVLLIIKVVRS